jgi:GntR family transcriptional regulator
LPNTVARAYRELELAGIVTKRRTAGTYVSDTTSPLARRERLKIVTERVDALLAEARQLNVATNTLIEIIQERDDAMQSVAAASSRIKEK